MAAISLQPRQPYPVVSEYGRFLPDGSFELSDPRTPRPWMHLLSNEEYLLAISQLGTGFSCYKSASGNLVTRSPGPEGTDCGRFFYIRNVASGEVFSPMVHPVHRDPSGYAEYRCVYSPGQMSWQVRHGEVGSRLRALVCPDDNAELYLLELVNHGAAEQAFDCFLYLEWLFSGPTAEWGFTTSASFDRQLNAVVASANLPPEYRFCQTGYITASSPILDFDCRRMAFLGTLGGPPLPAAVSAGRCFNTDGPVARQAATCGAVRVRLEVPPGKARTVMLAVGVAPDPSKLAEIAPRYHAAEAFEGHRARIEAAWRECFQVQRILEPADALGGFCNTWLKYQVIQNARWTRHAADKGYRDVLQDAAGSRMIDAGRSRRMIVEAVSHQRSDGHAPRQWSNVPFGRVDWRDYRDSCFWLVYAADAYLRESGDYDLLAATLPFIDKKEDKDVWTHLLLAMDYLWAQRGPHGLCLIGQGDWNDSLNRVGLKGRGESVWLTQAYCWALLKMAEIGQASGRLDRVEEFRKRYGELKDILNAVAWDGRWYTRAYTDSGKVLGSANSPDGGKIFLNSQSWAVISQTAPSDRAKLAFQSVAEHLDSDAGPILFAPRYTRYDPEIGRLSIGAVEADAVYVHAASFKLLADCMLGEGDQAYELLRRITPAARALPASQTGAEPYCYVNSFMGAGWPWPGWSHTGWWTGTCDWVLQTLVEWMYGARAEHGGLRVAPCLPGPWRTARICRQFRGATYDITIRKPAGLCRGEVRLTVDGQALAGDLLPAWGDGATHTVQCDIS